MQLLAWVLIFFLLLLIVLLFVTVSGFSRLSRRLGIGDQRGVELGSSVRKLVADFHGNLSSLGTKSDLSFLTNIVLEFRNAFDVLTRPVISEKTCEHCKGEGKVQRESSAPLVTAIVTEARSILRK